MKSLTFAFALFSSAFASAQNWYEIEIIIFEHTNSENSVELETWPSDLDLSWPSPLLELEPAIARPETSTEIKAAFEELSRDERRLNNDAYAVRVRDPYKLLWHKAWRAPLLDEDKAPWILVQADEKIGEHYRLEGGIRIHLSRYLHLNSNLWLTDISGPATFNPSLNQSINPPKLLSNSGNNDPTSNNNNDNQNLDALFDWSQLPTPVSIRWACNYIEEIWPETDRLLPDNYYQDPAPSEWYYPFGCESQSREDLPRSISVALSNQDSDAELRKNYPELFADDPIDETNLMDGLAAITTDMTTSGLSSNMDIIDNQIDGLGNGETERDINTLDQVFNEVRYPVSRIIHIADSRRMRSSELHYIDHPKIGIMAIIHPVEQPQLEQDSALVE